MHFTLLSVTLTCYAYVRWGMPSTAKWLRTVLARLILRSVGQPQQDCGADGFDYSHHARAVRLNDSKPLLPHVASPSQAVCHTECKHDPEAEDSIHTSAGPSTQVTGETSAHKHG